MSSAKTFYRSINWGEGIYLKRVRRRRVPAESIFLSEPQDNRMCKQRGLQKAKCLIQEMYSSH